MVPIDGYKTKRKDERMKSIKWADMATMLLAGVILIIASPYIVSGVNSLKGMVNNG